MSPRPTDPGALVRARLRAAGGTYFRLDGIDPLLREAIVATEDERFWGHHGIDMLGVARAAAYDVSHLTLQQGGPEPSASRLPAGPGNVTPLIPLRRNRYPGTPHSRKTPRIPPIVGSLLSR